MTVGRTPIIAVIGASECSPEQAAMAEEVGRLLAQRGVVLVCGGRGGIMEAACKGARNAGGITVGILPGVDHAQGNPYLSIAIPSGLGHARNIVVAQAGQVVIAIAGGYGTLSEVALALNAGKKVVGLCTWEAVRCDGKRAELLVVESAQEAVSTALSLLDLKDGDG